MRREKCRPFRRSELERRADLAELLAGCALHHPQKPRRGEVHDPALKMRTRGEVLGESSGFFGAQINQQAFGKYQDFVCAAIEFREERSACIAVAKVQS